MTDSPRILAVPGSLRDESYTRTARVHALRAAERAGGDTELLDLREYDLPLYDPDPEEPGDSELVKRKTREADGLLVGSPTYHNSYSAAFRNVHDYVLAASSPSDVAAPERRRRSNRYSRQ